MQKLDLDGAGDILARWLAQKRPGAQGLRVTRLATPKGGGASAESAYVDVDYIQDGARRTESLVLRRQLEGTDLFLNSDLRWQWNVLKAMGGRPQTPVPDLVGIEMDRSVLGGPFYVMQKVEGRIVPQTPNYNQAGWLADLPVGERGKVWRNAVEAFARVHRIDWRDGFEFMDDPKRGPPGLDQYFNYVEEWYAWAAKGREQPTGDAAMDYLRRNKPTDAPVSVVWGDPTPANTLFAPDNSVAGLIDWEMATLGPGELDLSWFLFFDGFYSDGMGVPRLEGLPSRAEIIAIYEAAVGRRVQNLAYYDLLAMVRMGIITLRACDRQVAYGKIRADSTAYKNNPIMAMIARHLDLPVPDVGADFAELMAATISHQQ
jgi:aminoglycoside phosphotransferase (APT) family kinase protein